MKVETIPFKYEHYLEIMLDAFTRREVDSGELIGAAEMGQTVETLIIDGQVVAIYGWISRGTVVTAFVIPSETLFRKYRFTARRLARKAANYFKWLIANTSIHRVQTVTRLEQPFVNWTLRLGFEHEGQMSKAAQDGSDLIMWGMV